AGRRADGYRLTDTELLALSGTVVGGILWVGVALVADAVKIGVRWIIRDDQRTGVVAVEEAVAVLVAVGLMVVRIAGGREPIAVCVTGRDGRAGLPGGVRRKRAGIEVVLDAIVVGVPAAA